MWLSRPGRTISANERKTVEAAGIEQVLKTSGKSVVASPGAAECGAVGAHSGKIDADLRTIIDTWPTLSESTKEEILAIVTHSISEADNGRR